MPYDLFISYAHRDNASGQVRELGDAIAEDFRKFAGRDLVAFFDERDIPSMADWEKRIAQGLRESCLFLAVISPNYFASPYCRREWEEYVRYEAMRQCLGEGVVPVYFVELPGLDGSGVDQSIAATVNEMRKRQWCDLASQKPTRIVPWHDAGRRALEDAEVACRLKVLQEQMADRLSRADRGQQSPTNIFRHNPQFVGRVRELTLLREALNERGSVGVVGHKSDTAAGAIAVHGLGGMGKTELALAYAHAFAWDYPGGRWLARCEAAENFDLVLRQLADPLRVIFTEEEEKDSHRAGERILAELRRRDRTLLLLDNVTNSELLGPDVLMRLPPQGRVHLLATTRLGPAQLAGSPHDHTFVGVDELPPDDALALIRAHQPDARFANTDDEVAAGQLVKLLDGFTLAVETAAIYLGRHHAPGAIAAYTERLRDQLLGQSDISAADPAVAVRHKEKLLERTLTVTFETLSAEQLYVLTLGALLPSDQIVLPWLQTVASDTLSTLKADSEWQQLANSLISLRLVQFGGHTHVVRMHRLVQELVRRMAWDEVDLMEQSLLTHLEDRAAILWSDWARHEQRWELEPLAAAARLWMKRQNPRGAYLAHQVATPLKELGDFTTAESLMRQALAINEQRLGPNHSNTVSALGSLAVLLHDTNRHVEAEPLLTQALARSEQNFGPNHPNVARDLSNLALLLEATNRWVEAEPLLRRALSIDEQHYGPNHANVAVRLNNLANLLQNTGRLPEAEPLLQRALAIWEQSGGADELNVAKAVNNLASVLCSTNRLREAEPLYRRALVLDEENYGLDHPNVAHDLNNLALLLRRTQRPTEAESLMRRALSIHEKSFGPDHPSVATDLNNLALVLCDANRPDDAEPMMRRALAIDEQSFGPDHPKVATNLANLAAFLWDRHRLVEAEPLMRRALRIDEQSFGATHPKVSSHLSNLAELLRATNRVQEAEPLIRRAIAIDELSLEPDHPDVAVRLNVLSQLLQSTNRLAEAKPLLQRALAIDESHCGPSHPNVAIRLNNLATLYCAQRRFEEGEQLLRRALDINVQNFGPAHPKVATSLNNLAQLLKDTYRFDEAEPMMRRVLAIDEQSYGADHPKVMVALNNLAQLFQMTERAAEAEPLFRRALVISENIFGPNHTQVAGMLNNLGQLLQELSRLQDAEPLMRRSVVILLRYHRQSGREHPDFEVIANNFGRLLGRMGLAPEQIRARLQQAYYEADSGP